MARRIITLLALLVFIPTGPAAADSDSILTVGVGAGAGLRHLGGGSFAPSETTFVNHGSVRVKMLWLLGADISVDLTKDDKLTEPAQDALVFASKIRTTALFYAIPASALSLYLGGGIGAPDVGHIFDPMSATNSYHVGGGLEVHLTDNFSIDLSYYIIVPSIGGIKREVERLALQVVDDFQGGSRAGEGAGVTEDLAIGDATVGDFVSAQNYEAMLRLFLFL